MLLFYILSCAIAVYIHSVSLRVSDLFFKLNASCFKSTLNETKRRSYLYNLAAIFFLIYYFICFYLYLSPSPSALAQCLSFSSIYLFYFEIYRPRSVISKLLLILGVGSRIRTRREHRMEGVCWVGLELRTGTRTRI